MVKINTRYKTAEDLNLLRGVNYWSKVKYFWRKGWIEIPVIMAVTPLSVIATAACISYMWYGQTHDLMPKYHTRFTIYRPDDPRVKRIRNESWFDYK